MRRSTLGAVPAIALLCFAACQSGEPPARAGAAGHLDTVGAALTLDHEALLRFQSDWNTVAENLPIYAGGRLRITYDPLRLPACRAQRADGSRWQLYARLTVVDTEGAELQSTVELRPAGRLHQAVWPVPEDAAALRMGFATLDPDGCSETDEGPDANGYGFETRTPSTPAGLTFGADWTQTATAAPKQGGLLQITYAPERLPVCRNRAYGGRAWNIIASWRFEPSGQTGNAALFVGSFYDDDAAYREPLVPVPEDATSVALWFSSSDRSGCSVWDSNFSNNYPFDVAPAQAPAGPEIGWAGDVRFVMLSDNRTDLGDVDPAYYWDSWQGAPLASEIEVQVWSPGLTDQAYPDLPALRAASARIFAVAETDAVAGDLPDGFGEVPLRFLAQRGNNFVFTLPLVNLRGPGEPVPDGLYTYRFALSTDAGQTRYYVTGAEGRDRRFVLADALACALFPDHAPAACPQQRVVDWAGDVGARRGGACTWRAGIDDPVTFTKSALGSDCMVLTADVYVAGLTDGGGDPRSIWARVESDLGFGGGPLAEPAAYGMISDGRVGNNYRYAWNLSAFVGRADRGDYRYRFTFSADEGRTWLVLDEANDGGWRTLRVRNDSLDVEPDHPERCADLWRFRGPGMQSETCVDYAVAAAFDAGFCEFYVNALGRGQFSQANATEAWLEAYLSIAPQQGELVEAGMLVHWTEGGEAHTGYVLGEPLEPGYWRTGLVVQSNAHGILRAVQDFAFFIDVRRPEGQVERLWQSAGGANYTLDAVFAEPGPRLNIGSGAIEYVHDQSSLLAARRQCAP